MDALFNESEFAARYKKRLAIVVPYRDRADHLAAFVAHAALYFARDKLDRHIPFTLHIVEQSGTATFNRGKIKNCGYRLVQDGCDYVCFHDVDYLPLWADYSWPTRPTRLAWHGLKRREDRESFFGAVVLFRNADFERVNGYPNAYWGWGSEDTELGLRCRHAFGRFDSREGSYVALPHKSDGLMRPGELNEEGQRSEALFRSRAPDIARWIAEDGLSTLAFRTLAQEPLRLNGAVVPNAFHHRVDIGEPDR